MLYVLVDNWSEYSSWIQESSPLEQRTDISKSRDGLREELKDVVVRCTNRTAQLQSTVLPGLDIFMEENFSIPVLQLENPSNHRWAILSHFGVSVKTDVHYYLSCLHQFKDKDPGRERMSHLYGCLQHHYDGNESVLWYENRMTRLLKETNGL